MNSIKNFFCLAILFSFISIFHTQTGTAQAQSPFSPLEYMKRAKRSEVEMASLLPGIQKINANAAQEAVVIFNTAIALCKRIEVAGSAMSATQMAGFQREFEGLDAQYAKFAAAKRETDGNSLEKCFRECGSSKDNPEASACKARCISGWLTMAGFDDNK